MRSLFFIVFCLLASTACAIESPDYDEETGLTRSPSATPATGDALSEDMLKNLIKRGVCQIRTFMYGKEKCISEKMFKDAKAVVFMESFCAGAIAAGFKKGRGFAVFLDNGKPTQRAPLFLREAGLSLGPQIGGKQTHRVWLLMDDEIVDQLEKKAKFKVGNDYGAVLGTAGKDKTGHFEGRHRSVPHEKDGHPASYFFSSSQGLSAGVRLEACRLKHWKQANALVLTSKPSGRLAGAKTLSLTQSAQEAFEALEPRQNSWQTAHRYR